MLAVGDIFKLKRDHQQVPAISTPSLVIVLSNGVLLESPVACLRYLVEIREQQNDSALLRPPSLVSWIFAPPYICGWVYIRSFLHDVRLAGLAKAARQGDPGTRSAVADGVPRPATKPQQKENRPKMDVLRTPLRIWRGASRRPKET